MIMNIYTLVKTKLNYETEVWHFPTLKEAQARMLEACSSLVGCPVQLNSNSYIADCWTVDIGDTYASVSDGNVTEFDIIKDTIDLCDYAIGSIVERVVKLAPACKSHEETIRSVIKGIDKAYMPPMDGEIDNFIDIELDVAMAHKAAEILTETEYCDADELYCTCVDYLTRQCGLSVMAIIIEGDEEAIEDVKRQINAAHGNGRDLFKNITVEKSVIRKSDILNALNVLIYNGIDEDEAETVLQAMGYALIDTELFPD